MDLVTITYITGIVVVFGVIFWKVKKHNEKAMEKPLKASNLSS